MRLINLLLIGGMLLFNSLLQASPIILNTDNGEYPLGLHLEIFEDVNGGHTIDTIINSNLDNLFVQSDDNVPNFGFSSSAYWVRFEVKNVSNADTKWLLRVAYPLLDKIDFFEQNNIGEYSKRSTGDYLPFSSREIKNRTFLFHLSLFPGETKVYYLRFETQSTMQFPLTIESMNTFIRVDHEEQYAFGIYYGIMLVMTLYNLFLFLGVRDRIYLYYVLYVVFYSFMQMTINGLAYEYLWPNSPHWASVALVFFVGFVGISVLSFSQTLLKTKKNLPRFHKALTMFKWVGVILVIMSQLFRYEISVKFCVAYAVFIPPFLMWIGILSLRQGHYVARYFLLAWVFLLCGMSTFALKAAGFLPSMFITEYGVQIGSALEVLLLSIALADRINREKKEKIIAQKEAMDAQQELLNANEKAFLAQKEALDNLTKMDKLKDEFLANTSHELRTPLNGIIGIIDSLIDGVTGKLSSDTLNNLRMVVQSAKRLSNLVNDILDFSKMKNKDLVLNLKPVDIRSIAQFVISMSQTLKGEKDLDLVFDISEDVPMVSADEDRLEQILQNLLGNSIKFTHTGEIRLSAFVREYNLVVVLSDTGIGIPKDKQKSVFDSFEQVDGSTAREYGGTGLGLSVTKKLVELHNGSIWLESEEGVGSTFFFTLPISEEQLDQEPTFNSTTISVENYVVDSTADETMRTTSVSEVKSSFPPILVVDDEPVNIQVLRNHLELNNYSVVSVADGFQALSLLSEQSFSLILLDLMMPRISGYEVCEKVRLNYSQTELPIIMLTAKNQVEDLVKGLHVGANDYLTKPFHKDELLARVRTHLELSAAIKYLNEAVRIKMELQTAKMVQELLIPKEDPKLDTIEVSSFYQSASETGGDWYGYYIFEDELHVLIGDVSGHGVQAALLTAISYSVFKTLKVYSMREDKDLFKNYLLLLEHLNEVIYLTVQDKFHMTFCYNVFNLKTKKLQYASGGHSPTLLYRKEGFDIPANGNTIKRYVRELFERDTFLGMIQGKTFESYEVPLQVGDVILWYTDGLIENLNSEDESFGRANIKKALKAYAYLSAEEIKEKLIKEAFAHYGSKKPEDDITLIVAKLK